MVVTTSLSYVSPQSHKAIRIFFSPTKTQEKFERILLQHVWKYYHTFLNRWKKPQKPLVIIQIHWSKLTLKTWIQSRNANQYTTLKSSCTSCTARLFAWGSELSRRQSQSLKSADRFQSLVSFPYTMDIRDGMTYVNSNTPQKLCYDILNQLPSITITSPQNKQLSLAVAKIKQNKFFFCVLYIRNWNFKILVLYGIATHK
jgi:hypothetical protein